MGLRPSVKSERDGSTNGKPRPRMVDNVNNAETEEKSRTNAGNVEMFSNHDEIESNNDVLRQQLQQPKQEAWTARGKLLLNFHDAISRAINSPEMMRKCSQIAKDMTESPTSSQACESTSSTSSSTAQDYQAEASLIIDNKSKRDAEVRNESIVVGLFSFATLRFCRNGLPYIRNAITRQMNVGGIYRFDRMPDVHHNLQKLSSQQKKINERPGRLRQSLNLAFDFTVSSSSALFSYTHLFYPRPSAYIQDMAELPLVEGKSLYAEMVCPPLMKEYGRVLDRYGKWPVKSPIEQDLHKQQQHSQQQQPTQEDVSLNIIRKFVENCTKRSKYERALLEERNAFNDALASRGDDADGIGAKLLKRFTKENMKDGRSENIVNDVKLGTVPVPSPGVPEDLFVDIDHDLHFFSGAGEAK